VLVSGDEDFVYAINAVAYKGCRVEVAGFRSNTAPRLIDVADFFIDLGDIADLIRKDLDHPGDYDVPSFVPPEDLSSAETRAAGREERKQRGVRFETALADVERDDTGELGRSGFNR
jgi:hypothetical protein